jgi:hypothetical protein
MGWSAIAAHIPYIHHQKTLFPQQSSHCYIKMYNIINNKLVKYYNLGWWIWLAGTDVQAQQHLFVDIDLHLFRLGLE